MQGMMVPFKVILSCRPAGCVCVCVCNVCQGCVLIRETGVCPWAAAEGQENLVVWESGGWDKSGRPAKHPLPGRVDVLESARSRPHLYTRVHTQTRILAPFLLASDTMVTEQPVPPCVPQPSRVSESKITTGTALRRWREAGGSRRATGGGVEGAGGRLKRC